jgi:hypothetical protein
MTDELADYNLPATAYTTFDAENLKSLIIQRLKEDGNFTDQVYEGSNMSAFIDVIAYSYHVLIYYLNRTSSESIFTESTIYENINRIVKLLNYSPVGYQTSTLSFDAFATDSLAPGSYTIPRYTFVKSNDTTYSISRDISFTKNTQLNEPLPIIGKQHLLHQGEWIEGRPMTAFGEEFEVHQILPTSSESDIDHFNVDVYIYDAAAEKYYEYREVPSVYTAGPTDRVFEKRLNETKTYEIKFGNDVTGAQLNPGDIIQVYYLQSSGKDGKVGANFLDDLSLAMYSSPIFTTIREDTQPENIKYVNFDDLQSLYFTNERPSEDPKDAEGVDDIKSKAPLYFTSRDRLVTTNDYKVYVQRHFGNVVKDTVIVHNTDFVDGHLKYLSEDVGVSYPNLESRVMLNHLPYASTTTYNNIYIYAVPSTDEIMSTTSATRFLSEAQKSAILTSIEGNKMISHEPIVMDPVYVLTGPCVTVPGELKTPALVDNTKIRVIKTGRSTRDTDALKQEVSQAIYSYFTGSSLGQLINIRELVDNILNIQGVDEIYTCRTDIDMETEGLSLGIWNPIYSSDFNVTTQNVKLPYFKYVTLHDISNLYDKIDVVESTNNTSKYTNISVNPDTY